MFAWKQSSSPINSAQKLSFLPFRKMRTLSALSYKTSFSLLMISQKLSTMLLWSHVLSPLSLRKNFFFFQSLLIIVLLPGFSNCEAGMQPQQGECQREPSCLFYVFHLVSMSLSWSCSRCKTVLFCLHHLCKPQLILGFGIVLKSQSFSCIYSFFLLRWQDKVDSCISFAFLYHPSCMKEL